MFSLRLSKRHKYLVWRAAIFFLQCFLFALSGAIAFLLRFEFGLPHRDVVYLVVALPVWVVVKGAVFHLLKLDRGGWRYASVPDLARLALGNLLGRLSPCSASCFWHPVDFRGPSTSLTFLSAAWRPLAHASPRDFCLITPVDQLSRPKRLLSTGLAKRG